MTSASSRSLFERVVEACGLAEVFAADSIERACRKAGFPSSALTPANLPSLMPHLKPVLKLFLGPDEAARRIDRIEALARGQGLGDP